MNKIINFIFFGLALLASPLLHACATTAASQTGSVCPNGSVTINVLSGAVTCNPPLTTTDGGNPSNGFTIVNADNTITYNSFSNVSSDSFVYTIQDGVGNTATGPVLINYNPQPTISDYSTNTCYNTTLNGTVPSANGGTPPYTYSIVTVVSGTATFTDPVAGTFQFTPSLNFAGLALVQYKATDSLGCDSDTRSVLVYVGPSATDQSFNVNPLNDNLGNYVQGGISPYIFSILSQVNGTVKLKIDKQHFTFTLNAGQTSGSFTFKAVDRGGCQATATVTVVLP